MNNENAKSLTVLSLGAGVQSSCVALMAAAGETQMPDHAIFADTGGEPANVYAYLKYLAPLLPFPVHVVSAGCLADDFLEALSDPKKRCGQPPFMVKALDKPDGQNTARIWRKCTADYKIKPIKRKIQTLLAKGQNVIQLIGISLDEAHRMKPSGVKYITNEYPLIDLRMSRHDCHEWIKKHGFQTPPKSACWFCPYMSNPRLRWMRDHAPDDWARLVGFDHEMRNRQREYINGAKITGTLYVHRDCLPIDEVDLTTETDRGQLDLFGEECEGMCGL
jgi:hypothetical protein